jgi:hypothetical protein
LTSLALLERRMRQENLPTAVPLNPTGDVMERLERYYGPDFHLVIQAVSLRHELLQNLQVSGPELQRTASTLSDLARVRYGLPPQAN